ncbi:MAG: hypothetical protein IPO05_16815 [Flavobacteriales bacterium]|nr:hypothetical protein [Flavobacteriales bacterium]
MEEVVFVLDRQVTVLWIMNYNSAEHDVIECSIIVCIIHVEYEPLTNSGCQGKADFREIIHGASQFQRVSLTVSCVQVTIDFGQLISH